MPVSTFFGIHLIIIFIFIYFLFWIFLGFHAFETKNISCNEMVMKPFAEMKK